MDIKDLNITVISQNLAESEQVLLARYLNEPIVKKWLQIMMFNQIADHANIPLSTIAEDGAYASALKQAFVKGGLSILQTINDIQPPQPISVQANQGQNTQR